MKVLVHAEIEIDDEKVADYTAEMIQGGEDPDVARGNAALQAAQDEIGAIGAVVVGIEW